VATLANFYATGYEYRCAASGEELRHLSTPRSANPFPTRLLSRWVVYTSVARLCGYPDSLRPGRCPYEGPPRVQQMGECDGQRRRRRCVDSGVVAGDASRAHAGIVRQGLL